VIINNIGNYIFDLDGVISNTAKVHALAWKETFDEILTSLKLDLFDLDHDYHKYFDGISRDVAIKNFLKHKKISLELGLITDCGIESINGLANFKNKIFIEKINSLGEADFIFQDSLNLIRILRHNNKNIYLASSSKNASLILKKSNLFDAFKSIYDGNTIEEYNLKSKPFPDIFNFCIDRNNILADDVVIFEDSVNGIEAALTSKSNLVIGLDRKKKLNETKFKIPACKFFGIVDNFLKLKVNL